MDSARQHCGRGAGGWSLLLDGSGGCEWVLSSSGAGLWGGSGQTERPHRDGGCGCSVRVLRVEERLRDHRWPDSLRLMLEMLFLSVSCSVFVGRLLGLGHAPGRRKEPGHLRLCGLDRAGELTGCVPGPPPFGLVDPRLRSMF